MVTCCALLYICSLGSWLLAPRYGSRSRRGQFRSSSWRSIHGLVPQSMPPWPRSFYRSAWVTPSSWLRSMSSRNSPRWPKATCTRRSRSGLPAIPTTTAFTSMVRRRSKTLARSVSWGRSAGMCRPTWCRESRHSQPGRGSRRTPICSRPQPLAIKGSCSKGTRLGFTRIRS